MTPSAAESTLTGRRTRRRRCRDTPSTAGLRTTASIHSTDLRTWTKPSPRAAAADVCSRTRPPAPRRRRAPRTAAVASERLDRGGGPIYRTSTSATTSCRGRTARLGRRRYGCVALTKLRTTTQPYPTSVSRRPRRVRQGASLCRRSTACRGPEAPSPSPPSSKFYNITRNTTRTVQSHARPQEGKAHGVMATR